MSIFYYYIYIYRHGYIRADIPFSSKHYLELSDELYNECITTFGSDRLIKVYIYLIIYLFIK